MLPVAVLELCANGIQARQRQSDARMLPYQGLR